MIQNWKSIIHGESSKVVTIFMRIKKVPVLPNIHMRLSHQTTLTIIYRRLKGRDDAAATTFHCLSEAQGMCF